jgi:hypothetical protein
VHDSAERPQPTIYIAVVMQDDRCDPQSLLLIDRAAFFSELKTRLTPATNSWAQKVWCVEERRPPW